MSWTPSLAACCSALCRRVPSSSSATASSPALRGWPRRSRSGFRPYGAERSKETPGLSGVSWRALPGALLGQPPRAGNESAAFPMAPAGLKQWALSMPLTCSAAISVPAVVRTCKRRITGFAKERDGTPTALSGREVRRRLGLQLDADDADDLV